jgi:cyclic pyranopterin phosphate synthase
VRRDRVVVTCSVSATYKTGVEMEALYAVTVALLTVWDMVKSLEKDAKGQYPTARISNVRVVAKEKGPGARRR